MDTLQKHCSVNIDIEPTDCFLPNGSSKMKTQMNINDMIDSLVVHNDLTKNRDLLAAALLWLMIDKEFHQF